MSANLATHHLVVDGHRRSLADWGLLDASLKLNEGGDDTLTVVEREAGFGSSQLTPLKRVELWSAGNRRVFSGVLESPMESYVAGKLRWVWNAPGPNYWLGRLPFTQPSSYYDDPTLDESEVSQTDTTDVILNRVPPGGGARVSLRGQVQEVFAQAETAEAPVFTALTEIPEQEMPEQRERVAKLRDILRALKREAPQLSLSWDYDAGVVNSDVRARWRRYVSDALGSPAGAMRIGDTTETVRTIAPLQINGQDGLKITPLYELLVRKLTVQFEWKHVFTDGSGRKFVRRAISQQVSTFENGAYGEERITIPLRGATIDNGDVTGQPEPIPLGNLAAWLHEVVARLWHKVEWTRHLAEPDWSVKIGQMWSVTGVGREVQACVQSITHEVGSGRTSVELGPPTKLSRLWLPMIELQRSDSPEYGRKEDDTDPSGPGGDDGADIPVRLIAQGMATPGLYLLKGKPA